MARCLLLQAAIANRIYTLTSENTAPRQHLSLTSNRSPLEETNVSRRVFFQAACTRVVVQLLVRTSVVGWLPSSRVDLLHSDLPCRTPPPERGPQTNQRHVEGE